jgi:hypothetical protein
MAGYEIRLLALAVIIAVVAVMVGIGRALVAGRRRRVLALPPLPELVHDDGANGLAVHILAFSSADCAQCHRLQTPALTRVLAARPNLVRMREVDAPATPELTQRYAILTVPSTVVLDSAGRTCAINYGFANSEKLLAQVDAVLGVHEASETSLPA